MHQQLWGYKVEWKSVSRGTGGKRLNTTGLHDVTESDSVFSQNKNEHLICSYSLQFILKRGGVFQSL
jgi:hypothetical protein